MTERTEDQALADVVAQLRVKFPTVPTEVVQAAVQREYAALDGPIRDFVPLLVARAASHELAQLDAFL